MKLIENIIPTVQAQIGGGGERTDETRFNIGDFNFLNPIRPVGDGTGQTQLENLFSLSIGIILTVAAIAAFIYLIISGFNYISAGGDSAKATTARQGIINALIGIVVIVLSFIVLRFVAGAIGPGIDEVGWVR